MTLRRKVVLICAVVVMIAIVTLPELGMGPAIFLDSERTVIARAVSPDGNRIGQVERIVVGGVPSIVVMVRPSWMPNWYLAGCAATSHYHETAASIRWLSNRSIEIRHADDRLEWATGAAPFHSKSCEDLLVTFFLSNS